MEDSIGTVRGLLYDWKQEALRGNVDEISLGMSHVKPIMLCVEDCEATGTMAVLDEIALWRDWKNTLVGWAFLLPWKGLEFYADALRVYGQEIHLPGGACYVYNRPEKKAPYYHGTWTFQRKFLQKNAVNGTYDKKVWCKSNLCSWTKDVSNSMGSLTVRNFTRNTANDSSTNLRSHAGIVALREVQIAYEWDCRVEKLSSFLSLVEDLESYLLINDRITRSLPDMIIPLSSLPVLIKLLRNKLESIRVSGDAVPTYDPSLLRIDLPPEELGTSMLYSDSCVDDIFQALVSGHGTVT